MNVALRRPMTLAEFLAWEERQELPFEFDGFAPRAMVGGTVGHSVIQRNLLSALATRLRGQRCQAFGSHLKIEVAGSIRYPDAFVVCTALPRGAKVVRDPVVIFEVLSESTGDTDRIVKNREYRDTPSVQRYVMLEQDRIGATVFARDGNDWTGHVLADADVLAMPEIRIEIPLTEIYAGLDFAAAEEAGGETPH